MSRVPGHYAFDPGGLNHKLVQAVNGNLEYGDNFRSTSFITVQAPGTPNTEFTINHNLGFVPNGYHVVGRDQTCDIFDSRRVSWTTSQMFLKCTVASVNLVLVVV